jgi:hypothetical protein
MKSKTIDKVLNDTENLDILKTAEAIHEKQKQELNQKTSLNYKRSAEAWTRHKIRLNTEESFRQRLAKVWNRKHKTP